jgi:O-antigen ligase
MPEYLKALVVILTIGTAVFYFAKPAFTQSLIPVENFDRQRKYWFLITATGFLSLNIWIFFLLLAGILVYVKNKEQNHIAVFFFLLLILPQIKIEIPGFAGIRYFIAIDYLQIVTLFILAPICLKNLASKNDTIKAPDYFLLAYFLLNVVLLTQYDDAIGIIRYTINITLDVFIPYYAISRGIKNIEAFKALLANFALGGMVVAAVGIFEFFRRWLLYRSFSDNLGLGWAPEYIQRGDFLRALATSGQPIVFGYVVVVLIGVYIYLGQFIESRVKYMLGLLLLAAAEVASLSKGPWVGLALLATLLVFTTKQRSKRLFQSTLLLVVAGFFLASSDIGTKIISYLPFVGTLDEGSTSYRQLVFDTSIQVIGQNPWFGSNDYLLKMEVLRQGQGIIDIVNSYIAVALQSGLVGLLLYVAFFLSIFKACYLATTSRSKGDTDQLLGRVLLSIMASILLIIGVCSTIFHIQILYVCMFALALAYARLPSVSPHTLQTQKHKA